MIVMVIGELMVFIMGVSVYALYPYPPTGLPALSLPTNQKLFVHPA